MKLMEKKKLTFYKKIMGNFLNQFKDSKIGVVGFIILSLFIFISLIGVYLSPYSIGVTKGDIMAVLKSPSSKHFIGTDELGRDLLTLIMYGGRISLLVGFLAAIISGVLGTMIGIIAGYFGGIKDDLLMRITDIFLVIPALPLMIVLAALLGPSFWNIIIVIGILGWTGTARVVRAQTLSLKERTFIESTKAIGAGDLRIILRHILPNILPLILAQMVLGVGGAILAESSLSFLGLGDPTSISWGMILHYAFYCGALSQNYWWYLLPPGLCIALVVVSFTFMGYALDQIMNPRLVRR